MESQTSDLKQRMGLGAGGRLRWLPPSAHVPTSPSQISCISQLALPSLQAVAGQG